MLLNEREDLRRYENENERDTLSCHCGVWDSDLDPKLINNLQQILDQERGNTCFFRPYQEEMSFEAAKILQERESENRQLKKSHRHTQIGLYIAAGAFVVTALSWVYTIIKDLWLD